MCLNNGNVKISLAEYIECNKTYLYNELGKDAKASIDSLIEKVSGANEESYTIVKSASDKYTTGFSAFAIRGPDEGTVTIAARGTEFGKLKDDPGSAIKDLMTDGELGYSSETDQQDKMNEFMEDLEGYDSIYLTGHSLGGNLAISGAVGFEYPDKIKGVYTYNAPGQNSAYLLTHAKGVLAVKDKITNFQNEGDMVSDINVPIGKTVIVKSDSGDSLDLTNNFKNHGMKDMTISNGSFSTKDSKSVTHYISGGSVSTLTAGLSAVALVTGIGGMYLADEIGPTLKKVGDWCGEKAKVAGEWIGNAYEYVTGKGRNNKDMGKKDNAIICDGSIDTAKIYATHRQIKEIVESYKDVNLEVSQITKKIKENWVGKGRNEFESQYNLLIKKIDDFGDTLQDIYDALVEAEAEYETSDDGLRQEFVKAIEG